VEDETAQPSSKNSMILEALSLRDENGNSLFSAIRNGNWNPPYFERVCEILVRASRLQREPLRDDVIARVCYILAAAFVAKDKWPFLPDSAEYRSLTRIVIALYEAVEGVGPQEASPLSEMSP
jgi:hypothetical protein